MEFKFQLEQHSMTLLSLNLLSQLSRERGVAKLALCGGLEVARRRRAAIAAVLCW